MNKNLIINLVQSMELKQTDIVLVQLWGEREQLDILDAFCLAVASCGATPVPLQHSRTFYKSLFEGSPDGAEVYPEAYFKTLEPVTAVLDLMAYRPAIPHSDFPKDKMDVYRTYMRRLMMSLSVKEKFVQLRLPTEEMAVESGIAFEKFSDMLESAYAVDYKELKATCESTANRLKETKTIEIETNGHRLSLSIEGRSWHQDAGNGDFPSGEIYIAPLETSANGELSIKEAFFEGTLYQELLLEFREGRLVSTNHEELNQAIQQLPDQANVLCEFGIGLNRNIAELTGFLVFDEKAFGTCHIGLGMNTLFGGNNHCNFHTDIVFKGDVSFDGEWLIAKGEWK